tara:strand:+ start:151 stop:303 length:153 start_codon:yes stop_codon:yes gene_type:complete
MRHDKGLICPSVGLSIQCSILKVYALLGTADYQKHGRGGFKKMNSQLWLK